MSTRWLIFMVLACGLIWYLSQSNAREMKRKYPEIFAKPISELEDYLRENLKVHKSDQRVFTIGALVVIAFSIWIGAWQPHQVKVEREKQHQAFLGGYAEGWNFYCDEIFNKSSISPNGILFAGSNSFTASWCKGLIGYGDAEDAYVKDGAGISSEYSSVDGNKGKGLNIGYRDSRAAVFSMVPYLCYGAECISNSSEESRIEGRAYQDWKDEQEYNYEPTP